MKSKKLQFIYLLGFCTIAYFVLSSYSSGITGQAASGCGGAGCHTPSANTTINFSGIPASYVYGTTYLCTLAVVNAAQAAGGFDLTVNLGTLATIGAGTQLNGTQEILHSMPKPAVSGVSFWTFNWTAPASGGQLVINVSGNAVNLNGNPSGDAFDNQQFTFAAPPAVTSPAVTNVTVNGITTTGATVNASVNANNNNTTAVIEYGLTAVYGSTSNMTPSPITGNTAVAATGNITGLNPGTLYHYRVKATNAGGITSSADGTFTTLVPASVSSIEKTSIELYPNPVADFIYYKNRENQSDVYFTIVSVNGATQKVQMNKIANGHYKIETNTLASGSYILVMELESKKYYHHFSK